MFSIRATDSNLADEMTAVPKSDAAVLSLLNGDDLNLLERWLRAGSCGRVLSVV